MTKKNCYPWVLVALYSCLGLTMPAAVTQYSMVVGEIASALGAPQQTILLTDTVRAVCLVCAMFFSGWCYRRMGLRGAIGLGLFFQLLPQFAIPFAVRTHSLWLLFLLKGMQGCNAIAFPLYISAIVMWVGDGGKGLATAVFNGSFVAGAGIGSWLSGRIVPLFGWESSFYLVGGLCLAFALPAVLLTRDRTQAPPDGGTKPPLGKGAPTKTGKGPLARVVARPATWLLILSLVANTWVTQAVTVDLSVYSAHLGYAYQETGDMMLLVSAVTVLSSALAGMVSDRAAARSSSPLRARCRVQEAGYLVSAAAALLLPFFAGRGIGALALFASLMMFGSSWAGGVFWALPSEVYPPRELVEGTGFCSSASNVPNPVAPAVVGVLLGSGGHWGAGWLTCAAVSVLSLGATWALCARGRGENVREPCENAAVD